MMGVEVAADLVGPLIFAAVAIALFIAIVAWLCGLATYSPRSCQSPRSLFPQRNRRLSAELDFPIQSGGG
jgi:hypothetical protein